MPAARVRPGCENEPRRINSGGDSARWTSRLGKNAARALGFELRFDREAHVVDRAVTRLVIAFTD